MSGQVLLYVDGACKGNPGPGGWAAVLRCGEHTKELVGGADHTTNNRMELQAAIEGLKALKKRSVVKLVTDSQYVIHMLNGARAKANQDLVEELRRLAGQHQVQAQWVKGHNGHELNELADELASREAAHRQQMVEAGWGDETVPQAKRLVMLIWRVVGSFLPQMAVVGCTGEWVGFGLVGSDGQTLLHTHHYTAGQEEYALWVEVINQLHEHQRVMGHLPGLSEPVDLVPLPLAEQVTDHTYWLTQLVEGAV
jgi:ribonuclease HI